MNLVIIRGVSGSGKSTLARQYTARGYDHCEADMYLDILTQEHGGTYQEYASNRIHLQAAHDWCLRMTREGLAAGRSVVVANTFVRRAWMEPYIHAAKEYGATVEVITCRGNFKSIHDVPADVLARQIQNFEE